MTRKKLFQLIQIVEITQRIKFFEARRDEYLHKMMYSNKEASRKNGIDNTINHTLIKNKSNLKNYDLRRGTYLNYNHQPLKWRNWYYQRL